MMGFNSNNYYFIFVAIGLIALLDGCANPIRQTLIPFYVAEESLVEANGIAETVTQTIQIGTWFFGSMLLIVFSPNQLIWIVTVLFIFSSIFLNLLKNVEHKEERQEKNGLN